MKGNEKRIVPMIAVGAVLAALGCGGSKQQEPVQPVPTEQQVPGPEQAPGQVPPPAEAPPAQPGEPPAGQPPGQPPGPQGMRQGRGDVFGYTPEAPAGREWEAGTGQAASPLPILTFVEDVQALSSAPADPARSQAAAVGAMRSMALAFRAVPDAPGRAYSAATTIEAQAGLLERGGPQVCADVAKDALGEGIDALDAIAREHPGSGVDRHAALARSAAARIDPAASFQQERADITEAFQHVSDGLVLAGQQDDE